MSARRPWAWPLVPAYAAALWCKARTLRAPATLASPVVSVGSVSAGGAGKTPVVIALAELFEKHGWVVDVLSRGYGRSGKGVERVFPEAIDAADHFGDEPTLMAQRTGVPVWVGVDRYAAGMAAEGEVRGEGLVHLLDDGFQHRRLARTFDIALLTLEDLDDVLLPAGNLREPLSALRRADAVVVRERERERVLPRLRPLLRPGAKIWIIRRKLRFTSPLAVLGAGLRPMAFCALARPEDFAAMVQAAGCGLVETMSFSDHHRYTPNDMERILTVARDLRVTGFVTSEKDAVKLTPEMRAQLAAVGPLLIARLDVEFADGAAVLRDVEARLA